jgi:hypothetical protein
MMAPVINCRRQTGDFRTESGLCLSDGASVSYFFKFGVWRRVELPQKSWVKNSDYPFPIPGSTAREILPTGRGFPNLQFPLSPHGYFPSVWNFQMSGVPSEWTVAR